MSAAAISARSRFSELDVFRGLAALCVGFSHLVIHFDRLNGYDNGGEWIPEMSDLVSHFLGLLPVTFFFMISGFVIAMSLERSRHPLDFIVSRASRLFPAYWFALAIVLAIIWISPGPTDLVRPSSSEILANALMVQSMVGVGNIDPVYWSLGVELRFYIMMAIVSFSPLRRHLNAILIGWVCIAYIAGFLARANIDDGPILSVIFQSLNVPYAHFFVAGIIFHQIATDRWTGPRFILLTATGLAPLLYWQLGPAIIAMTFWAIFSLAVAGKLKWIVQPPLIWLGSISYCFYLVHLPTGQTLSSVMNAMGVQAELIMVVSISTSLALAAFATYIVERPAIHAIRRRYRAFTADKSAKAMSGIASQPGLLAKKA